MTKFVPGSKLLQVFIEVKNPSWPGHPAFFTENDYRFFLDCLRQAKLKCVCRICAYVSSMTNHFHLLVKPSRLVIQVDAKRGAKVCSVYQMRPTTDREPLYELNPVRAA